MVGRLVENEDVWVCEREAGEGDAGFLTAGEEGHFLEAGGAGYAEAVVMRGVSIGDGLLDIDKKKRRVEAHTRQDDDDTPRLACRESSSP